METESSQPTLLGEAPVVEPDERLGPAQRRVVRRCLSALGVLGAASMVGVAFSLYLVNHYPLLLIALSPLGRHLVLVAPIVDPFAFVAVGLARRMAFYLIMFWLGRALGPAGIRWIEARAVHFGRFVRWVERLFARSSHVVVFAMAGPTVSALAGISGMRTGVFLGLATPGLIVRLVIVLGFAEWLRQPIEWLLARIDEYWIPGTVVLVIGMAIYQWRRRAALLARRV
jgi:membrane protein DedA with SNARE-associated domain